MLCGLALGASVLLAGCGGGGSSSSGGGNGASLAAGSYQGAYVSTSGQFSPDAGTIAFTVNSSGAVSGSSRDYTGDGSTNSFTGTVSSTGALVTNAVTGTLSQDSTTHVLSTSFTETNGTKGVLKVGLAPTSSAFAGSYSGTATSSGTSGTFPLTLSISSAGAVTGTLGTPVAGNPNSGFNIAGYVDASGSAYLAYTSGGVPTLSLLRLALNGTALTGTLQETASDGSTPSGTVSLTKQ